MLLSFVVHVRGASLPRSDYKGHRSGKVKKHCLKGLTPYEFHPGFVVRLPPPLMFILPLWCKSMSCATLNVSRMDYQ